MNEIRANRILINNHWLSIGIILIVTYWFFESSIDAFILDEGNFLDRVFNPGTRELMMRVVVISIIMIGAYLLNLSVIQNKITEEAMILAKDYTKNLINSSLDMIIAVNPDGNIIEFNPAAETTFGYSKAEVLGKHINILYAQKRKGLKIHKTTLKNGRCVEIINNIRKDGTEFPCLLAASVIRDFHGRQVGVMGVSRDISERIHYETLVKESEKKRRRKTI